MSNTYSGKATIYGHGTSAVSGGISGIASLTLDTFDVSQDIPVDVLRDKNNAPIGIFSAEGLVRAAMNFSVAATSTANAALAVAEPTRQAAVTLANFAPAALNHARWAIWPGSWKLAFKKDGIATYSCEIVCSTDTGVNLAATIS